TAQSRLGYTGKFIYPPQFQQFSSISGVCRVQHITSKCDNQRCGPPDGWSLPKGERKVRSPQGSVPANGRGQHCRHGKCNRKYTASPQGGVRVKRCGKSAPRQE